MHVVYDSCLSTCAPPPKITTSIRCAASQLFPKIEVMRPFPYSLLESAAVRLVCHQLWHISQIAISFWHTRVIFACSSSMVRVAVHDMFQRSWRSKIIVVVLRMLSKHVHQRTGAHGRIVSRQCNSDIGTVSLEISDLS